MTCAWHHERSLSVRGMPHPRQDCVENDIKLTLGLISHSRKYWHSCRTFARQIKSYWIKRYRIYRKSHVFRHWRPRCTSMHQSVSGSLLVSCYTSLSDTYYNNNRRLRHLTPLTTRMCDVSRVIRHWVFGVSPEGHTSLRDLGYNDPECTNRHHVVLHSQMYNDICAICHQVPGCVMSTWLYCVGITNLSPFRAIKNKWLNYCLETVLSFKPSV